MYLACLSASRSTSDGRPPSKTPKPRALQEWLQARKMKPQYTWSPSLGEAHRQTFEVECAIAALALSASRHRRASRRAGVDRRRRPADLH